MQSVNMGVMFSFLKEKNGHVAIANRIFEMRLLKMFITEEASKSDTFCDIYGDNDEKFIEVYGS